MYLQIGTEDFIKTEDIIGVFDLDNTTVNKATRDYLNEAQKADVVKTVTFDLPKSFIVTEENGQRKVYISALNTATIYKRISERI
ncbi:MAG: DUF370 domain-containing protein [Clostridiaceae bacterium]|nr:DUF370 domain-containing protein [Clostridiaceae bacterium]